jgi:malate synthase
MAKASRGIEVGPKLSRDDTRVLSEDALDFLTTLARAGGRPTDRVAELTTVRPETSAIRDGAWKIAPLPRDLADVRTGLVTALSRKELMLALNSGARLCLADFCDFTPPSWDILMDGQRNLIDRWTSAMDFVDPVTGKRMSLSQRLATLMVRPRALQTEETRVKVDDQPIAAGLFDAGLYLYHNAKVSLAKASGPYLCLSGVASRVDARTWNDLLIHAESLLGLPLGSIRVNIMTGTPGVMLQLDEMAYELRDRMTGFSMGGQRFAFSAALQALARKGGTLPDAFDLDRAWQGFVIHSAHKRGCLALAAMTRDTARDHAERAVRAGFDGLWTGHPDHVAAAAKVFNDDMPTANQIYVTREDVTGPPDAAPGLADVKTEDLFRADIDATLILYEAWLAGRGPVSIEGVVEDVASAEFRRLRLWHWIRLGAKLDTGRKAGEALYEDCVLDALKRLKAERGEEAYRGGRFRDATVLLRSLVLAKELEPDFTALALKKLA